VDTNEAIKAIEAKFQEKLESLNLVDRDEVNAIKSELDAVKNNENVELKESLAKLEEQIEAMKEEAQEVSTMSFSESIMKGLKDNYDNLVALKNKDRNATFTFKAAGDMTNGGNISGGNVPVEDRLSGLNRIPSRRIRLMDLMSQGSTSSRVVSWVYQANQDGQAGFTAEGDTKNQIDFDLVVANETVKKYTAFIKVSDEMLTDIDFIESQIRIELSQELLKSIEDAAYDGDGSATALNGVYTVATPFAAGSFATGQPNEVDNPNSVDVLGVAMNQIMIAEQDTPNAILMHPSDVTALKMQKVSSTDKRYVERLAMVAGELSLDGVRIIPTTLVDEGDYLIGDFTKAQFLTRDAMSVEVGYDGNDFTKNMRTIRAEWRGVVLVKNNDRSAFVKGDFATDIAAITKA